MALDTATLQRLSKTFTRFQNELAARPALEQQLSQAESKAAAVEAKLQASLVSLGYQGNETPEEFLSRVSADIEERLTRLESLYAPKQPSLAQSPSKPPVAPTIHLGLRS
jgi:hypothetical protein